MDVLENMDTNLNDDINNICKNPTIRNNGTSIEVAAGFLSEAYKPGAKTQITASLYSTCADNDKYDQVSNLAFRLGFYSMAVTVRPYAVLISLTIGGPYAVLISLVI